MGQSCGLQVPETPPMTALKCLLLLSHSLTVCEDRRLMNSKLGASISISRNQACVFIASTHETYISDFFRLVEISVKTQKWKYGVLTRGQVAPCWVEWRWNHQSDLCLLFSGNERRRASNIHTTGNEKPCWFLLNPGVG